MPEERELDGLKREMTKLADHLDGLDDGLLDPEAVGDILRQLLEGAMATDIIEDFGLVSDEMDPPGV